ncbi:M28 family peptidase [Geodermatophilaceae bacterium NBWT11]|nr:M28 family peptidase [Geodermatophilaceae bacterium NBWT11]
MRPAGRLGSRPTGLLALALVAVLPWFAVLAVQPPEPVAADAPADVFSAERAHEQVQWIAAETHVTGSAANDRVRERLVDTLTGLGLETRVQDTIGMNPGGPGEVEAARVRTVVGLLPGSDPTGRLFLVAHHDSVETGPGGNDDAAGVSSVLETLRALTAGPQLRNDVVVVFTDAEEACLCGAEAFVDQDELAADGGVVLNLEARGTSGPPVTFETSLGNAGVAAAYAAAAVHPVATSFAVEVYRLLPNDTDFSPFLDAGSFTGLNTAYIDGSAAYHTPEDTPSRMDRGSLQAMGDNALALTRSLGAADLAGLSTPSASDATYFPVLGALVTLPGWTVWPLAGLAALTVLGLAVAARHRGTTTVPRLLAGLGAGLLPLVLAPLAAQGLWALLVLVRPDYAGMTDPWQPGWYRAGVVALVLLVLLGWYALLRRRVGAVALAVGGLAWLAVLGLVLAAFAPGGSYLAALPALVAAVTGTVAVLVGSPVVRLVAALVGAAVAVVVLAPTVVLFFPALGLATGGAPALFAVFLGLAALPVLELLFPAEGRGSWPVPAVAGVLAVALVGTGLVVDRFDADHPVPTQLMYALDADTGDAWWVSTEDAPVDWTQQYLDGDPVELSEVFPVLPEGARTGPAEPADLPAPEVTATREDDTVTVRVEPRRDARLVVVEVRGVTVTGAEVEGREVPGEVLGEGRLTVTVHAPPADGVDLAFIVTGDGPVDVRVVDGSDGLADLPGFVPRPDDVGVAGTHTSDLLVVGTTVRVD